MPATTDVHDIRALASQAARDGLAKMGAAPDRPRFEDLVSDLTIVGLVARQRFTPEIGQGMSTWCYRTMRRRIPDHFRRLRG